LQHFAKLLAIIPMALAYLIEAVEQIGSWILGF